MKLIKKYSTFFKYILSAGISFLIDISLFTIFLKLLKSNLNSYAIIIATICARIISSLVNYTLNRNNVFKKADNKKYDSKSLTQYTLLVIIQMLVSSFSVFTIYNLTNYNETIIKLFVECVLFIVNYFIKKKIIFKPKNEL